MREQRNFIAAIDGPSGVGKSTVSKGLAAATDAQYLNTGSMYRMVTLQVIRDKVDPGDQRETAKICSRLISSGQLLVGIEPDDDKAWLDGEEVSEVLRGESVTQAVSAVSASAELRAELVKEQQKLIALHPRIVVEGRDIGSVVAPNAQVKVFLTATAAARAQRRADQNQELHLPTNHGLIQEDLERRDAFDAQRHASPFRQNEDAVVLDTSQLTVQESIQWLVNLVKERGLL